MMVEGRPFMHFVELLIICMILPLTQPPGAAPAATDCADRLEPGTYGVPAAEPAFRAGLLAVPGFRPIYLEKHSAPEADPALCNYVTVYDVFRLSYREPRSLLAGCYGDFTGDGRRGYALLLQGEGGVVIPHVFVAVPPRYRAFKLPKVVDPYGFNEDQRLWPGPFCLKKPAGGQFKFLEIGSVHVVGDVIEVGWYAYYWSPDKAGFEAVLVKD